MILILELLRVEVKRNKYPFVKEVEAEKNL